MKNSLLVIIFTIVGLAIYIGFFYHKHLQDKKKSETQKKQRFAFEKAFAKAERGSTFGGRKKRKLKK